MRAPKLVREPGTVLPDNPYEEFDERFRTLISGSAKLEELFSDARWAEGPVWFSDLQCLLFSDIPNERILRYVPGGGVSVYRQNSAFANGNTRDHQGRLVTCHHGARAVIRTELDGTQTVLADQFEGGRLNSPNDVVVKSDGSVWFTDPTYGIMSDYEGYASPPEQATRNVYCLEPDGTLRAVITDFGQPNGLAFSPHETRLYVADSAASHDPDHPRHIRQFSVDAFNHVSGGEELCVIDNGIPDGFRCDTDGNIWLSAGDGVHVFAPDGTRLGKIKLPQTVANLTFGGSRRTHLYITATRSLYRLYIGIPGAARC